MQYTDKELEIMISNYNQLRIQLQAVRENIMTPYTITDTNTGGGSSSKISNPTEMTAIRLTDDDVLKDIKNIGLAIENTYALLPYDKKKMMKAYFIERDYTINETEIAKRLHIGRSTLWRWKNEIINLYKKELKELERKENEKREKRKLETP